MKVLINGTEKILNLSGAKNLSEVLDAVSKDQLQSDRLITEVQVNGKTFHLQEDEGASKVSCDEVESLAVTVRDSAEVIQQSVAETLAYIQDLTPLMLKTGEFYRLGRSQEANQLFSQCLDAVQRLFRSCMVIKTALGVVQIDLDLKNLLVLEGQGGALEIFQSMLEAQTHRDWILLADLLEYEATPLLKQWFGQLEKIQGKLKALGNAG